MNRRTFLKLIAGSGVGLFVQRDSPEPTINPKRWQVEVPTLNRPPNGTIVCTALFWPEVQGITYSYSDLILVSTSGDVTTHRFGDHEHISGISVANEGNTIAVATENYADQSINFLRFFGLDGDVISESSLEERISDLTWNKKLDMLTYSREIPDSPEQYVFSLKSGSELQHTRRPEVLGGGYYVRDYNMGFSADGRLLVIRQIRRYSDIGKTPSYHRDIRTELHVVDIDGTESNVVARGGEPTEKTKTHTEGLGHPFTSPVINRAIWLPEGEIAYIIRDMITPQMNEGGLYKVKDDGSENQEIELPVDDILELGLSPDDRLITFSGVKNGEIGEPSREPAQLYVLEVDSHNLRRLTQGPNWNKYFSWAPDSAQLAYISTRSEHGKGYHTGVPNVFIVSPGRDITQITDYQLNCRDFDPRFDSGSACGAHTNLQRVLWSPNV